LQKWKREGQTELA